MLRRTNITQKRHARTSWGLFPLDPHKFHELNQWQRNAMGISQSEMKLPGRTVATKERFNAHSMHITRGTSAFAWKWRYAQQSQLPNLRPEGQSAPIRSGQAAWPAAWDPEFAASILAKSEDQLKEDIITLMTTVIFKETQRDGYELRRLDFESKPLTELPERDIIEAFVLEEESIRERVVQRIVEEEYRFSPTSDDMKELRNYSNICDYIVDKVETCRPPPLDRAVSESVKEVLEAHPLQPEVGFDLAVPGPRFDSQLLDHWERMFHHDWQFGKAVYTPRTEEKKQGNVTWMQEEHIYKDRLRFQKFVESGDAEKMHREKIRLAAEK